MSKIVKKSPEQIELMRVAGAIVAETHALVERSIRPGMRTGELDALAEEYIRSRGARPAFKNYRGFPATLCVSINEMVVHGIPGRRRIEENDVVSVDVGAVYKGWHGDSAWTYYVGEAPDGVARFLKVSRDSLQAGIGKAVVGGRVGDIGRAVQRTAEKAGYGVVRDLVGHGIGRELHEDPRIPNYGIPGTGELIEEGMVFAIEPMINMGSHEVRLLQDGWSFVTCDGSLSCHFEHTVAVTREGPRILTRPMEDDRTGENRGAADQKRERTTL